MPVRWKSNLIALKLSFFQAVPGPPAVGAGSFQDPILSFLSRIPLDPYKVV